VAVVIFLLQVGNLLIVSRVPPQPDAYIVLGSHEWERFPALVRVAAPTPRATVFLTEPVHLTAHNCAACGERVPWLAHLGIARSRVVILPRRVTNTHDEALAALDYARQHPFKRLVVVTSPYHTRRALTTFTSVFAATGIAIGVYPALTESGAVPSHWWSAGYDRWYVAYEGAAVVWYALRYGVNPFVA
jgi:uncharacterized SAM-binding protein YcdF (DUF218 family)